MQQIKLSNSSSICLVDDDDYKKISKRKWYANSSGYAVTTCRDNNIQRTIRMHRIVVSAKLNQIVDHKNRNRLDNRKQNLRFCSRSQNAGNSNKSSKKKTSKYKGVSFFKPTKKWVSSIRFNGKGIHIGYFVSEKSAALAYNEYALFLFGKFACINVVSK